MEIYDHFTVGETLATHLRDIAHTPKHPRFFTAFGIEDLYDFEDRLSCVSGTILIAIDSNESDTTDNRADSLIDRAAYSFVVARNTNSDRTSTIQESVRKCKLIVKQIRNRLFLTPSLQGIIDHDTQITGIGPIGDNFYGVILTFYLDTPESYFIDPNYWKED